MAMKMDPKFVQWRDGYRPAIAADVAHKALETLRKSGGGALDAGAVVSAAASKQSPLHPAFEWDDGKAAHEFRLEQARRMMRSLVVVRPDAPKQATRVYEIHREQKTPAEARTVYRTLEDIMSDDAARAELLQRTLNELISIRRKFAAMKELAIVWRAVDEALESFKA